MAGVSLGLGTCPLCGSAKAKFSFSDASQLAYLTCNACNLQVFARSDNSDARLRGLVHKSAPVSPVPVEEKAAPVPAAPAPAAIEKVADKQTKNEPAGFSWGVLGHG